MPINLSTLGFKGIAYTDNITVAISVLYLNTFVSRMEIAHKTLSNWRDQINFIFEKIKEVNSLTNQNSTSG